MVCQCSDTFRFQILFSTVAAMLQLYLEPYAVVRHLTPDLWQLEICRCDNKAKLSRFIQQAEYKSDRVPHLCKNAPGNTRSQRICPCFSDLDGSCQPGMSRKEGHYQGSTSKRCSHLQTNMLNRSGNVSRVFVGGHMYIYIYTHTVAQNRFLAS